MMRLHEALGKECVRTGTDIPGKAPIVEMVWQMEAPSGGLDEWRGIMVAVRDLFCSAGSLTA